MTGTETVTVRILDREYQVNCPPEEKDALMKASRMLDERMRTIRQSGTVIGLERIAVMAALNLVYDLDKAQESSREGAALNTDLKRIDDKLTVALKSLEQSASF